MIPRDLPTTGSIDAVPTTEINHGLAAARFIDRLPGEKFAFDVPGGGGRRSAATVRFGLVSSGTAASWDNGANTMTPGSIEAWPFTAGVVDRDAATTTLPHWFTDTPTTGALVGWLGNQVVVLTCEAVDGFS